MMAEGWSGWLRLRSIRASEVMGSNRSKRVKDPGRSSITWKIFALSLVTKFFFLKLGTRPQDPSMVWSFWILFSILLCASILLSWMARLRIVMRAMTRRPSVTLPFMAPERKHVLMLCSGRSEMGSLLMEHVSFRAHLGISHSELWQDWTVDKNPQMQPDFVRDLLQPNALRLFLNNSFDVVVLNTCGCCTRDLIFQDNTLLMQIKRVLKHDGKFYFKAHHELLEYCEREGKTNQWSREQMQAMGLVFKEDVQCEVVFPGKWTPWPIKKRVTLPYTVWQKSFDKTGFQ